MKAVQACPTMLCLYVKSKYKTDDLYCAMSAGFYPLSSSDILIVEGKAFNQSAGNPIENYGIKRPFRGNKEHLNPAERTEDEG